MRPSLSSVALPLLLVACTGPETPPAPAEAPVAAPAEAPVAEAPPSPPATLMLGDVEVSAASFGPQRSLEEKVAICAQCHGKNGGGDADFGPEANWGTPALRGLSAGYMVNQLQAWRDGGRSHKEMGPLAAMLSEEDSLQLSAWYAALPVPASVEQPAPGRATAQMLALGAQIAEQGLPDKGLLACRGCHGDRGAGNEALGPRLAGQIARYSAAQIAAIRAGERSGGLTSAMAPIAAALSEEETAAVTAWFEALVPR